MPAHILVDLHIHDKEGYSKYPPLVWPIIEKHGGKVTHRISGFEQIEGNCCPQRVLILEFPDKEAARAFLEDPDYIPVKAIRVKSARSSLVLGNAE